MNDTPEQMANEIIDLPPDPAEPTAAERQRDEYLGMLKQERADFENYQKRSARDREAERRYASSPLILDLLPALDNLERALSVARQAGDEGPLMQGVGGTFKQLLDGLRRHGVTTIEVAAGTPFDPNRHQAVMQRPAEGREPGVILESFQAGYLLHDRVLRPASVVVSQ